MRNLALACVPCLLLIAIGGCNPTSKPPAVAMADAKPEAPAPTPPANMWVTSDDGVLALRLSVAAPRVAGEANIETTVEIRNESQQPLTIIRPCGDKYAARAGSIKIWDRDHQIPYTGPKASYVVGSSAFVVIKPGEVVQDKLEVSIDNRADTKPKGQYTLRYDYSYDGHWDKTAAANNSGIKDIWCGTISSREVIVVRE